MSHCEHQQEVNGEESPEQRHLVLEEDVSGKYEKGNDSHGHKSIVTGIDEIINGKKEKEKERESSSSIFSRVVSYVISLCGH